MPTTIRNRYLALAAAGELEADSAQQALIERFVALEERLAQKRLARKSSSLGWLFASRETRAEPVRGLYIHGDVGRGKTMLMDLFFETTSVQRKRRAHFHQFMADVHERVHAYRQQPAQPGGPDPIQQTAAAIAGETWLLCFDEFHVTDIADAMILGRLFTRLFELGVVVVATSNIEPDGLYKDGLNRALFLPFIEMLKRHVDVVRLEARADFRLEKLTGMRTWYVPINAAATAALDEAWLRLTGVSEGSPQELMIKSRVVRVPQAAMGVARFSFAELCREALAASDYLRIALAFHTLIVDGIPVMDYDRRNEAKRFIILIDTLYDLGVKFLASAEAEPHLLYLATEGYEAIEFHRTASRLIEMRSQEYLGLAHGPRHEKPPALDDIVET